MIRTARLRSWKPGLSTQMMRCSGSRVKAAGPAQLGEIEADPSLAAPILDRLSADPSAYVRKSVANHPNDVMKTHPAWVLERVGQWHGDNHHTRWIVRHGLRTLVKQGNKEALAVLGAGGRLRLCPRRSA